MKSSSICKIGNKGGEPSPQFAFKHGLSTYLASTEEIKFSMNDAGDYSHDFRNSRLMNCHHQRDRKKVEHNLQNRKQIGGGSLHSLHLSTNFRPISLVHSKTEFNSLMGRGALYDVSCWQNNQRIMRLKKCRASRMMLMCSKDIQWIIRLCCSHFHLSG